MLRLRSKNPDIILTPISDEEREKYEKEFMGDENIFLYWQMFGN